MHHIPFPLLGNSVYVIQSVESCILARCAQLYLHTNFHKETASTLPYAHFATLVQACVAVQFPAARQVLSQADGELGLG
jgi:hypothetical protein